MKLKDLADHPAILQAELRQPDFDLHALHCDSRRVDAQTGFLALKGEITDGHRFLEQALGAGAPVLFVSSKKEFARKSAHPRDVAGVFLIPPGRKALADLAGALAGHPSRSLTLLGVTGTNGKTTVVHLLSQLLEGMGKSCAMLGTLGTTLGGVTDTAHFTTPEAPDIQGFLRRCLEAGETSVSMEISSHGLALERVRGLFFAAAAFTNLTQDHLDYHGSLENYRNQKFRLFLERDTARTVVNLDDPVGGLLADSLRKAGRGDAMITFALDREADLILENVSKGESGFSGQARYGGRRAHFRFSLPGRFNLSNLLAALGLLLSAGERLEDAAGAIHLCRGAAGRFERVPIDAPFTVIVDSAVTPDALDNLLQAARPLAAGSLALLFGCGGERDREKRPLMAAVAEKLADRLILSNDNPRRENPHLILTHIAAGLKGTVPTTTIADRREAIHQLLDEGKPGDVLVISGKGGETYLEIDGVKHPFEDTQVVWEWARTRGKEGATLEGHSSR